MLPADSSILSPILHVSKQLYFENEILQYKKVCPLILMKITHLAQLCTDAPSPLSNPELLFLTSYRTVSFSLTSAERLCLRFLQTRMRGVRWFSLLHLKKKRLKRHDFPSHERKLAARYFLFQVQDVCPGDIRVHVKAPRERKSQQHTPDLVRGFCQGDTRPDTVHSSSSDRAGTP